MLVSCPRLSQRRIPLPACFRSVITEYRVIHRRNYRSVPFIFSSSRFSSHFRPFSSQELSVSSSDSHSMSHASRLIGALDQGTSSTRFILFSETGAVVDSHQEEIQQIYTDGQTGWTEQDPVEIFNSCLKCIEAVMKRRRKEEIIAVGITNQRETTVLWDSATGKPLHNAIGQSPFIYIFCTNSPSINIIFSSNMLMIWLLMNPFQFLIWLVLTCSVWHDSRTSDVVSEIIAEQGDADAFRPIVGLPISTYFSAIKLHWILHKAPHLPPQYRRSLSPSLSTALKNNTALFGTVDSWLIWCLTGGINGGVHVTDVSNASRTLLMRLSDCKWDENICSQLKIPMNLLPTIKSSAEIYGRISLGTLAGLPLAGCLGDQQAALVGQLCLSPGTAKNTYGTGCFLLLNTGEKIVTSSKGLLTTVGYQLGPTSPIIYALEGSVAAAAEWWR